MRPRYVDRHRWRNRPYRAPTRRTGKRNDLNTSILAPGLRSGNRSADQYSESMLTMAHVAHKFATAAAKSGRGDLAWWSRKIEQAMRLIWEVQQRLESYQREPGGADEGEAPR